MKKTKRTIQQRRAADILHMIRDAAQRGYRMHTPMDERAQTKKLKNFLKHMHQLRTPKVSRCENF